MPKSALCVHFVKEALPKKTPSQEVRKLSQPSRLQGHPPCPFQSHGPQGTRRTSHLPCPNVQTSPKPGRNLHTLERRAVLQDPTLLQRKSKTDQKNVGPSAANMLQDGLILLALSVKITVLYPTDPQTRMASHKALGGSQSDPLSSPEKEDTKPPLFCLPEQILSKIDPRDALRKRGPVSLRQAKHACSIRQRKIRGAEQLSQFGIPTAGLQHQKIGRKHTGQAISR